MDARDDNPNASAAADLTVERNAGVMFIRLNRPDRANAIGGTLLRDLIAAFDEATEDDDVRAVVTTGVGKTYCVGADIADLEGITDMPAREMLSSSAVGGDKGFASLSATQRVFDDLGNSGRVAQALWNLEKPTIAAINGAAVGGGLGLAMLHDIRIASESASLGTGFATLGIAPELGMSYVLPRVVGMSAAATLLYSSEVISGREAERIGLVSKAVPAGDVVSQAVELAEKIASNPSLATRWAKRLLRHSLAADLHSQLRAEYTAQISLFDHPDTRQAIAATLARLREK
jgi:enoyl-CoA hydratase/carnithine racemase